MLIYVDRCGGLNGCDDDALLTLLSDVCRAVRTRRGQTNIDVLKPLIAKEKVLERIVVIQCQVGEGS